MDERQELREGQISLPKAANFRLMNLYFISFSILFVGLPLYQFVAIYYTFTSRINSIYFYIMIVLLLLTWLYFNRCFLYQTFSTAMSRIAISVLLWNMMISLYGFVYLSPIVGQESATRIVLIDSLVPALYFLFGISAIAGVTEPLGKSVIFCFAAILFALLFAVIFQAGLAGFSLSAVRNARPGYSLLYQWMGNVLAFWGFHFVMMQTNWKRWIGLLSCIILMYILGSIASLLAFIFCLIVLYAMLKIKENSLLKKGVNLAVLVVLLTFLFFDQSKLPLSHYVWNSLNARIDILKSNLPYLSNSLVFGNYHFEILLGREGTYTHNIISILEQYGLYPFIVICTLYYKMIVKLLSQLHKVEHALCFLLVIYSLILLLTARSVYFYEFWYPIGMYLALASFRAKSATVKGDDVLYERISNM